MDDEGSSGLPEIAGVSSMPRSPIVPPLSTSEEEVEVVEAGLLSGGYLSREDVEFFIGTTGFIEETDKGKGNGKKKKTLPADLHK